MADGTSGPRSGGVRVGMLGSCPSGPDPPGRCSPSPCRQPRRGGHARRRPRSPAGRRRAQHRTPAERAAARVPRLATPRSSAPTAAVARDGAPDRRSPRSPHRATRPSRVAWVTPSRSPSFPQPKPKSLSKAELAAGGGSGGSSPSSFKGRNHVWIPALGINRSVSFFSCSSSRLPRQPRLPLGLRRLEQRLPVRPCPQRVQAAPRRLRPRPAVEGHEGLLRRRQRQGQHVRRVVVEGHHARQGRAGPTPASPRPSLTLQTCVGARSQYRLIVRLLKVG